MITDGATGEIVTLMSAGRTYLKVSPEQTKAMLEQLQKFRLPDRSRQNSSRHGKKEKISDYDCESLHRDDGCTLTTTYWLRPRISPTSSSLSSGAALAKFRVRNDLGDEQRADAGPQGFPQEMPMKTEMDLGGKKIITTLVLARRRMWIPACSIFRRTTKQSHFTDAELSAEVIEPAFSAYASAR